MKSNRKKRIIAAVLCMVMVLTSNISALAGGEIFVDTPAAVEELSSEPAAVAETEPEVSVSDTEAITEAETSGEFSAEPASETPAGSETTAPSEEPAAAAEVTFSDGEAETEAPAGETQEPEAVASPTPEAEATAEAEEESAADFGDGAAAEEQVLSGATELKQEFTDADGNVIQRVTANLPMGAFAAETSAVTMEVNYLDTDSANYVKSMMTQLLPEGMQLGTHVFFDIEFKVNGEKAEALQPITITIEGSNLTITDTKKANVFYLRKADPAVEGDKDELKEIPQRAEVLESLQAAGESTENIEDYDLSEITFREDGTTDKIIFEGRKSTIYGCYVEEEKPAEDTTTQEEQPGENPEQGAEEVNPETATEVEIISDDVNLRTQPDAEADNVAAVAYTGERYPLLETVEAGEATWYKIQYTNPETGEVAELYVRSDFAKLVEGVVEVTDDETVEIAEEPETVTELTYEDEQVTVVVSATEEGIIPEGAKLSVTPITADNADTQAQYDEVAQHVEEKVAEEEKEVAGFLVYDICFVDAEGKKLEPNGKVKVSMNYKEAVIPENMVAKNEEDKENTEATEVAILHLEEDENGEVQNVVDMTAEESAEATIQTTETTEVQSAEFVTNSFSSYVFVWSENRGNPSARITFVDANNRDISSWLGIYKDQTVEIGKENGNLGDKGTSLEKLGVQYEKNGYAFLEARLDSIDSDTVATDISYNSGKWYYYLGEWLVWKNQHQDTVDVVLVYAKKASLPEEETVDLTGTGITMRMQNYSSPANGINIGGAYEDANGAITYDLLQSKLRDGYPVTASGQSLSSLFTNGTAVNNLFLQDKLTNEGYYEYSSFNNYAYLDGTNFRVYKAIGTPSNENLSFYQRGNFMPYNDISANHPSRNTNLYNPNGELLADGTDEKGKTLYKTLGGNDYYFGMYLESAFLQPKDGQALFKGNKSPMRYEFNGDDDLWVFIDDVLVLDIGGIHDAHSGYIDFSTGEVVTYNCTTNAAPQKVTTTIKAMFEKAGADTSGFEGDTFKDYTKHTFKMFYMERGAGASNLHMRFNLQVIPAGQIQVTKELKQENDPILYGDIQFGFELYVEEADEDGKGTGKFKLVTAGDLTEYAAKLKDKNGKLTDLTMNAQNRFYLKPNQTALFNNIPENLKYYVSEVDVKSEKFDKVEVNGLEVTNKTEDGDKKTYSAISPEETVAVRPSVIFTNACSVANDRTLQIEKKMQGDQSSSDTFYMKLEIEGDDGNLYQYSGDYTVFDGPKDSTGTVENTANTKGYIALQKNQIASVYHILSETKFKVTEVEHDTGKYLDPTYQVSVNKDDSTSYVSGQEGEIVLNHDAKVIVTNHYRTTVSVEKVWEPSTPAGITGVYVGLYKTEGDKLIATGEPVLLNPANEWKHTFIGLEGEVSQYVARELYLVGSNGDFTIDSKDYSKIEEGSTVSLTDGNKYIVNYNERSGEGTKTFTITNTALWQIFKVSENDAVGGGKLKLEGAEFTAVADGKTYVGSSNAEGLIQWSEGTTSITNLPYGAVYTVTETKAPSGYVNSEFTWTVDLSGDSPVITYNGTTLQSELVEGIKSFYFTNKPLYDLPSTGGSGIFGYMIGGVALMMAAMFILYKMRSKGVLGS